MLWVGGSALIFVRPDYLSRRLIAPDTSAAIVPFLTQTTIVQLLLWLLLAIDTSAKLNGIGKTLRTKNVSLSQSIVLSFPLVVGIPQEEKTILCTKIQSLASVGDSIAPFVFYICAQMQAILSRPVQRQKVAISCLRNGR